MTNEHLHVELSVRQLRRWARNTFDQFFCALSPGIVPFGKENVWHVQTDVLPRGGFVLSAGVGHDISFEKELVATRSCRVLLLDPSPTGIATMARSENQVAGIEYLPVGLAEQDGVKRFSLPVHADEGSFTAVRTGAPEVAFECRSLPSLMAERNLPTIDLLKLDIEGFEYDVIESALAAKLPIRQICLEYHHFLPDVPASKTLRSVAALYRAGFRIAHKRGCDYTFVRNSATMRAS
jgi:FkbM family methyltransferase